MVDDDFSLSFGVHSFCFRFSSSFLNVFFPFFSEWLVGWLEVLLPCRTFCSCCLLLSSLGSNHGIVIYSPSSFSFSLFVPLLPSIDAISRLIAAFWPAPTCLEIPARARSNTSRLTINAYQVWFLTFCFLLYVVCTRRLVVLLSSLV